MAYRLPFDGNYPITCDWACHKSKGGVTAQYAGVDWSMPIGTPLYSLEAGNVTTGTDQYGALFVNLKSMDGHRVWQYLHLSRFGHTGAVDPNMHVGFSGNSGYSTGPHLHFVVFVDGVRTDPLTLINATPTNDIAVSKYIMYTKERYIRQGNGTAYPTQVLAKEGSVWYVKGGPRRSQDLNGKPVGDPYIWWDVQACNPISGELAAGSGWSALQSTAGASWAVVVPKPVPPVVDPCEARIAEVKAGYEKQIAELKKGYDTKLEAEAKTLHDVANRLSGLL